MGLDEFARAHYQDGFLTGYEEGWQAALDGIRKGLTVEEVEESLRELTEEYRVRSAVAD